MQKSTNDGYTLVGEYNSFQARDADGNMEYVTDVFWVEGVPVPKGTKLYIKTVDTEKQTV